MNMRWSARLLLFAFAALIAGAVIYGKKAEGAGGNTLNLRAASAVMLDAETGEWLYDYAGDEALPPASMSKMMTEALVLEDIAKGRLTWEDTVTVSRYAAAVPGAAMGLQSGETVSVRELFEAMAVHSANDAAVALAERTSGSEAAFARRMNAKARKIGLSDRTSFANATGLPRADLAGLEGAAAEGDTVMTAKDAARLARYLIRTYPDILAVTAMSDARRQGAAEPLRTTNELLPGQRFGTAGADGLKTGYTEKAGYCFTGTAERGGVRLVTVVMGTATAESRFEETRKLLAYGWEKRL